MVEDERHGGLRDARLVGDVDHRRPARRGASAQHGRRLFAVSVARGAQRAVSLPHPRLATRFANIIIALSHC